MSATKTKKSRSKETRKADPLALGKFLWPRVTFYDRQKEVIQSVWRDDETFVPAGNMLGKDFVAAFVALTYFLMHQPCRVVTTSVKDDHLRVLWGELKRFIQNMEVEPDANSRLIINHREIRRYVNGVPDEISYILGMVSERGEGLAGHHAPHTLLITDEASGLDDAVYNFGDTWAAHKLIIGNPNPCTNFFYKGVKAGDHKASDGKKYHRKVIKIKATDSPNVKLGMAQKETGKQISDEELVPGVIGYKEYLRRRELWDEMRQCIGLDAEFYEGAEVLIFPPEWLKISKNRAKLLSGEERRAKTIGIDVGEGDANTCWAVSDELGLLELVSKRTRDTSQIFGHTRALMDKHGVKAENVYFDRGGGGKQHADYMRQSGHEVRTVAFGESIKPPLEEGYKPIEERQEHNEQRYAYRNRRAQMYGMLRERMDPSINEEVYAVPEEYEELHRQLGLIPLEYDGEGRMVLPPKTKRSANQRTQTLIDIIGCSPDEADALVLAVYGLAQEPKAILGPVF